jgi:hypothetical protein
LEIKTKQNSPEYYNDYILVLDISRQCCFKVEFNQSPY